MKVDASGKGAENVARDVPSKIRNCPHRMADPSSSQSRLGRATERLADARGLLDAVDAVIEQAGVVARSADVLLEAFDEAIEDVDRMIELAAAAEAEETASLAAVRSELAVLTGGDPDPAAGVRSANDRLAEAGEDLDLLPFRHKDARPLRTELGRLQGRAGALRAGLEKGGGAQAGTL